MSIKSICVYCGASTRADPAYLDMAIDLGTRMAADKIRLIYGGGNVGLMGAVSRTVHENGGDVLGIMPHFLTKWEKPNPAIETIMVETMHERKWRMFLEADAFITLPGGIGTLEEVVETLSWARLELHNKPVVLVGKTFWQPFADLIKDTIDHKLTPEDFPRFFQIVDSPAEAMAAVTNWGQKAI